MENLEQKEAQLLEKIKTQVGDQLKEVSGIVNELKSKNTSLEAKYAELEQKAASIKTADPEQVKLISDEVTRIAGELKASQETRTTKKRATIEELLQGKDAEIKAFLKSKSGSIQLDLKATQTSADIGSGDSWDTLGRDHWGQWHEGGRVGQIPTRQPFMQELFKSVPAISEHIKYVDQDTVVRDAKNVAGCGASTHNTKVTFKKRTIEIEKVRDFVHICDDMLDDYSFVAGEIRNLISSSVELKIDNDLLLGTGVSPIINGVAKYASTFDAAASGANYANTAPSANVIDLFSTAGQQIKQFGMMNAYRPNVVAVNPKTAQLIKFLKNTQGDYLNNNQLVKQYFVDGASHYFIDGLQMIENPLVAENTAYVFDSRKGTIYYKPGVGIEFSYENRDNFETETVTVKAYRRLNLLVRNVDANAFMFISDINAGIAAINKI